MKASRGNSITSIVLALAIIFAAIGGLARGREIKELTARVTALEKVCK